MEDFVNNDIIEKVLDENGYSNYKYNAGKNAISNIEACTKDKEEKQRIKKRIIETIATKEDVKSSYSKFLNMIKEKLNAL